MSEKDKNDNIEKTSHAMREERILKSWYDKQIFKKSLDKKSPKGNFTFYDGPPFATGLPHYGHILAGTIKDVMPRFKTMRGYHVERRWGWDCHGLPVENLIEKELNLNSKKDILEYGLGRFNASAQQSVMRYADEWRKIVPRLGRFVDMDDDYRTMDATYTETVWWIFKNLYDKGLIYEGFKSMNLCPRCETTLSNFEVAQGYKDITDISVYVKFKISNFKSQISNQKTEGDTYLLAWTTTPWTLPGNAGLAVNPDMEYVRVRLLDEGEGLILAKNRLSVLKEKKYEVIESIKGNDLVGVSYEPAFDFYSKEQSLKNKENGWKVYPADFVTAEDGTGIVHIAPAFGADDYDLSLKYNIPFIQHVSVDGTFKPAVIGFAGLHVKPKDTEADKNAHQNTDVEIIKYLAQKGTLFDKEKLVHSYPHCWRCDTPLINYAASSWFVKVSQFRDKLVKANEKIKWVPEEIGKYRFGNWLAEARDWAISRSRFWGAPIPVWKEENTNKCHVIGSVEDIKKYSHSKNTYYLMRHGQSENNVTDILNSDVTKPYHLTDTGREQAKQSAKNFKDKVDIIYASPFLRTKETAEIFAEMTGFPKDKIIFDDRLREMGMGPLEGTKASSLRKDYKNENDFFSDLSKGKESIESMKKRTGQFLQEIDGKHSGKNILIVGHEGPQWLLAAASLALPNDQVVSLKEGNRYYLQNAQIRKIDYHPLPHNENFELDLHRPFIDELDLRTKEGNKLFRVPDVFDCWFESGSMPYGEAHYPFENGKGRLGFDPKSGLFKKSKGYPADFIAEGLDQTRGWFYSMLVLGVALFGTSPYKKVIVNGLVLAEDGQKMSKSKKNYPDPMFLVDKYGADAMRYYMISSPVVHGQDLRFSEKGVDEVTKKVINRVLNVLSFYEMYSSGNSVCVVSDNVLDKWIVSRMNSTIEAVTNGLEDGELDRASRPILDFVDDMSTWYLRRSRGRFKDEESADKEKALSTTAFILRESSKIMAPFMPFLAEELYMRSGGDLESVHLAEWPSFSTPDLALEKSMNKVRNIASLGLESRTKAKIGVRQPLSKLSVKQTSDGLTEDLLEIIKDEVNVKEIVFNPQMTNGSELDTNITPQLEEEGMVREFIRTIQELRKGNGLTVKDRPVLNVDANNETRSFLEKNEKEIKSATLLSSIRFTEVQGEPVSIGKISVKIGF